MQIRIFKFAEDSEMPTIEKETFALSSIMRISLTPHIKEINNYTFYSCNNIKAFIISENSEITTTNKSAFAKSSVETFTFSSKVEKLEEWRFSTTSNLTKIVIPPENKNFSSMDELHKIVVWKFASELDFYDVLIFASRDIKDFTIDSKIRYIAPYAFYE